jgi:hypothetical protein
LPILMDMAKRDGPAAVEQLNKMMAAAMRLLPAA